MRFIFTICLHTYVFADPINPYRYNGQYGQGNQYPYRSQNQYTNQSPNSAWNIYPYHYQNVNPNQYRNQNPNQYPNQYQSQSWNQGTSTETKVGMKINSSFSDFLFKMDDMLLTSEQMKMFKNGPSVFRSYHTDMLWNQNWSSFENKYLIPFIAHPVRESRESFRERLSY